MTNSFIRIFDQFSNAECARDELLRVGFDATRLHLDVRDDGAVPVQGNFYVGDPVDSGKETHTEQGIGGFLKSLIDSDKDDYNGTFRHAAQSATYVLTIHAENDAEAGIARDVAAKHGALPTDEGPYADVKGSQV